MKVRSIETGEVFEVLDTDYPYNEDGSYASVEPDMIKLSDGWHKAWFYEWIFEE